MTLPGPGREREREWGQALVWGPSPGAAQDRDRGLWTHRRARTHAHTHTDTHTHQPPPGTSQKTEQALGRHQLPPEQKPNELETRGEEQVILSLKRSHCSARLGFLVNRQVPSTTETYHEGPACPPSATPAASFLPSTLWYQDAGQDCNPKACSLRTFLKSGCSHTLFLKCRKKG